MNEDELKSVIADANLSDDEKVAKAKEIMKAAEEKAAESARSERGSLVSMFTAQSPAAKDPVQVMREVLADKNYSQEEKELLFFMSRERFQNRRKMAYIALYVLVGAAIFLAVGWAADFLGRSSMLSNCLQGIAGLPETMTAAQKDVAIAALGEGACTEYPFTQIIKDNTDVLSWLGTFFTSVIALYFGAASFRPTS